MSEQTENATTTTTTTTITRITYDNVEPSTSAKACGQLPGHTVGCGCQCCCAARSASEPCTCPPEMQMSDSGSDHTDDHSHTTDHSHIHIGPHKGGTAKKPSQKPPMWQKCLRLLAKEYNFINAPEPLFVGPQLGGSGYRWQCQLPGHIPNCPCERCQLLQGNSYRHTIRNNSKIYKFDSSYYGKIAHIPNCPCPPCRVKRGLSRMPPPKLPKFKYKPEKVLKKEDVAQVQESEEPNYDTHPLNCTCSECCHSQGNEKPAGHSNECKCLQCRRAAGLVKPPGHSFNCTCELCCAAAGNLKPPGHKLDCRCMACMLAIESTMEITIDENKPGGGITQGPHGQIEIQKPPPAPQTNENENSCRVCLYIVAAVFIVLLISMYIYWVGTL